MVVRLNNSWTQFGIVSFGCALPNYPSVYTRVSRYQDWIYRAISNGQLGFVTFLFSYHVSHIFFCLFFFFISPSSPSSSPSLTSRYEIQIKHTCSYKMIKGQFTEPDKNTS